MTQQIEHIEVAGGCTLWTATTGAGPPVVLCHGGPGLWDYLSPVATMLDDSCTVHRWDQRGAGRSTIVGPYATDRFVADLEALRAHFGHERWIVGGHSWGASLALQYALRYPERTRALLYLSGIGIGESWRAAFHEEQRRRLRARGVEDRWLELEGRARTAAEERESCVLSWMTDYVDVERGRAWAETTLATGFLPNYEVNRAIGAEVAAQSEAAMITRCRQLMRPALLIHGAEDPRPVSAIDSLVDALPQVRRVVIDAAGHVPWDEQPAAFANALRAFIASLPDEP